MLHSLDNKTRLYFYTGLYWGKKKKSIEINIKLLGHVQKKRVKFRFTEGAAK